jgi:hypothetical protein
MAAVNGKANGHGQANGAKANGGGGARRRFARREDLGLSKSQFATLERLDTPQKIQAYLNATPINHEIGGGRCVKVTERRAHCVGHDVRRRPRCTEERRS